MSIACGTAYLITIPWHPFPGSVVLKGLSIGALAVLAFRWSYLLGLGLALSSVGDFLLDWDPRRLFVSGLVCFLCAHLVYTLLFVSTGPRRPKMGIIVPVLAYSLVFSWWLVPSLGALTVPVLIYICAITAMVLSATMAGFGTPWVAIGAVLFLISDSLLAADKFKTEVPLRDYLVWTTYYLAQYSITIGVSRAGPGGACAPAGGGGGAPWFQ